MRVHDIGNALMSEEFLCTIEEPCMSEFPAAADINRALWRPLRRSVVCDKTRCEREPKWLRNSMHACAFPSSMCALLVTATDVGATDVGVSDVTYRCDLDAIWLLVRCDLDAIWLLVIVDRVCLCCCIYLFLSTLCRHMPCL